MALLVGNTYGKKIPIYKGKWVLLLSNVSNVRLTKERENDNIRIGLTTTGSGTPQSWDSTVDMYQKQAFVNHSVAVDLYAYFTADDSVHNEDKTFIHVM